MAKTLMLKLIAILSLIIFQLVALHSEHAPPAQDEENDYEEYVLDSINYANTSVKRSRFLASSIKKGAHCDAKYNPYVCNGVLADKGKSLLYCCKKHCRNVLGDRNNCGRCSHKCQLGQRCCGGVCTNVMYNRANCGKCGKKCSHGVKCEYGYCGYA